MTRRIMGLIVVGIASIGFQAGLPAHAAGDGGYRAGAGDTLNVVVYGEDKLSGRFRVSPAGTISYPLVGEVAVANLSTIEIGRRIAAALAERIPSSGLPSVEIVEYAPVFVIGNVDKPGPYQYRPDMTVLELVALGGGERRVASSESVMLQIISTEQELVDLRIARWSELVRKTRVRAEIAGQEFDGKEAIAGGELVAAGTRQSVVDNEVSLFRVRRTILAEQNKALAAQRASYDQEIASLEEGIKLHDEELRLLEQEVGTQQGLYDKGLAVQPRLLAVKRELSATRRNALELRSFLARAHQRQLEVDQKIAELRDQWVRDNATMLAELDISTARRDERIGSLVAALGELRGQASSMRDADRRTTKYSVTRQEEGRYVTRPIGELDAIAPRDILRIDVPGPGRVSEGATMPHAPPRDLAAR
ncbi:MULTISPECIES: polysaccharide biosynthesis/export family protein [unclassified Chelatococcus]|uniref:polysaccharide biosynthesis/export family protein n=1 Tax=unclassified Chelatococcus TaxID=2638111 RepID=UPI001BCA7EB8|nr:MULTISPECIES: polysaccharide biosynthesis/export family protein [unclassified Chelatococcus]CAH1650175.1 Polysaccharide export outer membrane protein [Hyphomicrobiales bacterium]MBS7739699.1 polysaccharide biosynthesis/export family protein [Chelatococcus sp. HY11]MBX3544068.1 polysaccharide biosynthesis/export family protein [Chelatococcus sp.]MCO5075764.1 polysaccharide biosynthesis/export family protein [Chelatococcus sp.]CAH1666572.1 Polysaccharide export outer membrane protein [Hyphomi